MAVMEL